ncbi:MAG: T9SS type A sorting domain-containing protein [Flavipsychrobacter sp.]|nr:T9SS type A sorting domain-containing protein [Flavipsychrobacter sp.]
MKKYLLLFAGLASTLTGLAQTSVDPGLTPGNTGTVSFTYRGSSVTLTSVRTVDGNIWLRQNLGSTQVATSATDPASYGDYFQWGRWDDGHQTSTSTTAPAPSTNNPTGVTGSNFYLNFWNAGTGSDTWNGTTATATNGKDPCTALGTGWHMPSYAEYAGVFASTSENITSSASAFSSHLKLSEAGFRDYSTGSMTGTGTVGLLWTSTPTVAAGYAGTATYAGGPTITNYPQNRGFGQPCRCMKNGSSVGTTVIGSTSLCANETTIVSGAPSGGTYTSSNTGAATVNSTSGLVTGLGAGSTTITYTTTSGSATLVITVNALPVVAPITGPSAVCGGSSITLNTTTTGGTWSSSSSIANIGNASTGIVTGVNGSGGTATIYYSVATNGCVGQATRTVVVYPNPIPVISGILALCPRGTTTLSSVPSSGVWSSSNTAVATVNSSNGLVTGITVGTSNISFNTTASSMGCTAVGTTTVTVNSGAPATPAPITGNLNTCLNKPDTLHSNTVGGAWSSANNSVATINGTTGILTTVSAGTSVITYKVGSGGCSNQVTATVTVNALPVPIVTATGLVLSTGTFTNYSWSKNGVPIAGATAQSYTATSNGDYTVTVTDVNGCTGTSAIKTITGVGIENVLINNDVSIYPNPASTIVTIVSDKRVTVSVGGMDGRELMRKEGVKTLDISALASGIYLLKIYDQTGHLLKVERLVKCNK